MKRFTRIFSYFSEQTPNFSKVLLVFLAFTAFFAVGSARLEYEEEVIALGETLEVSVTKHYSTLNSNQVSINIPQNQEPENIRAVDENGTMPCEFRQVFGNEIVCQPDNFGKENYSVTISYETPDTSELTDDYKKFEHRKLFSTSLERYSLEIILPEGSGIVSSNSEDLIPFEPEYATTGSEGRRIFVRWDLDDVSLGETENFAVRYQELDELRNIISFDASTIGTIIVLLIAVLIPVYFKFIKDDDTIASILPLLKEDEKQVLMYIIDKGGECEQKNLVKDIDYSKAKVSRLVKDLVERNLVKKIKEGRKNRLVLKKDVGNIDN